MKIEDNDSSEEESDNEDEKTYKKIKKILIQLRKNRDQYDGNDLKIVN